MEQLNRIELRGNVGMVRVNSYEGRRVANISVPTSILFKSRNSESAAFLETTWHNVVAWEGKGIPDIDLLVKGTPINVVGRLRSRSYVSSDGLNKTEYEVVASEITILEESLSTPSGS